MYQFRIEALQEIMKEKGWKAADLARAMSVTDACLSRVLNGTRNPGIEFIMGLKAALPHYSLDYFFEKTVTDRERKRGNGNA